PCDLPLSAIGYISSIGHYIQDLHLLLFSHFDTVNPVQSILTVIMTPYAVANTFWNSFIASSSLITASELGDKTFFITSILSVQKSRIAVFLGAMTAMTVMNVLSSKFLCIRICLLKGSMEQYFKI